jgi:hypothetical protein
VETLREAERPRNEWRDLCRIGMQRIHQDHVCLGKNLRLHGRQQAATLIQPGHDPFPDSVIVLDIGGMPVRYRSATTTARPASDATFTTGAPGGE